LYVISYQFSLPNCVWPANKFSFSNCMSPATQYSLPNFVSPANLFSLMIFMSPTNQFSSTTFYGSSSLVHWWIPNQEWFNACNDFIVWLSNMWNTRM
jgi:hypothetical protein